MHSTRHAALAIAVYCAGDDQRTERCHLLKDAAWLKVAMCWGRGGPMKIAFEICVPVFASRSTSMKRRPRWGKRGTFEAAGSDCSARSRGTAPRPATPIAKRGGHLSLLSRTKAEPSRTTAPLRRAALICFDLPASRQIIAGFRETGAPQFPAGLL